MRRVNHRPITRRAVAALAGALLAIPAGAIPAASTPAGAGAANGRSRMTSPVQPAGDIPAGFGTWAEVFAAQDKLNAAAEKIVAARGDGYAGIVAAPHNRQLHVYWKGKVPEQVRALAGGLGVPVRWRPARFTERELLAEAERLSADPQVLSIGPEVDGGGLRVNVTAAGRQAIRSGIGILGSTTVPLNIESGPEPTPLRQNDISPYWGGARYTTPISGGCSTGFAIWWGFLHHILSAGHCGNNGQTVIDGGGNPAVDTMGGIFNDVPQRDTLMINVQSEGIAYVGAFDSNFGIDVIGAAADFVGNVICTGGARTGEHCGLVVTHVNQTDSGYRPLTRAVHPTGGCGGARGDSGGPVYHYTADGWIIGRGTISTGRAGTASCPNAPTWDSSSVEFYAPLLRPEGDPEVGSLQYYFAAVI